MLVAALVQRFPLPFAVYRLYASFSPNSFPPLTFFSITQEYGFHDVFSVRPHSQYCKFFFFSCLIYSRSPPYVSGTPLLPLLAVRTSLTSLFLDMNDAGMDDLLNEFHFPSLSSLMLRRARVSSCRFDKLICQHSPQLVSLSLHKGYWLPSWHFSVLERLDLEGRHAAAGSCARVSVA